MYSETFVYSYPMENKEIISFIIVEYHSIDEVKKCANTLSRHITLPMEIIISSNSCYDKDVQQNILKEQINNVTWLFNECNGGFAYAMNQGLRVSKGAYLVIMNSDCTIHSGDGIAQMVTFLQKHEDVGAIAPQIIDNEGNIQDTARPYVSLPRILWRQVLRLTCKKISILEKNMDYNRIQTIDWVIGAFIMVTRKAYELTNGLDESYFMYAEDMDWCTRIRDKGLEIVYYPKTNITYKGTRRARHSTKYAKIFLDSHLTYWKRYGFVYGYPKRKKATY